MSLKNANAYMRSIKRDVQFIDEAAALKACHPYDCETVLGVVADFGRQAGYDFTDEEYKTAATEEVEALLGTGQLAGDGEFIRFSRELVEGRGDFLIFRRGSRERDGLMYTGDQYVNLWGGSVR